MSWPATHRLQRTIYLTLPLTSAQQEALLARMPYDGLLVMYATS
jgi:hypothetical protein